MKASITPLLLAFSLVLGLTHSTTALADETQALIKERIDGFKASKKSVKTIAQAIEKQDNQVIIEQAELLYAFSDKIPSLYPENAKGGFFPKPNPTFGIIFLTLNKKQRISIKAQAS